MSISIELYAFAVLGSVSAEVCAAHQSFLQGKRKLPKRYFTVSFYVVRLLLTLMSGCLPIAFAVSEPAAAFVLGVSAPLFVSGLKRRFGAARETNGSGKVTGV